MNESESRSIIHPFLKHLAKAYLCPDNHIFRAFREYYSKLEEGRLNMSISDRSQYPIILDPTIQIFIHYRKTDKTLAIVSSKFQQYLYYLASKNSYRRKADLREAQEELTKLFDKASNSQERVAAVTFSDAESIYQTAEIEYYNRVDKEISKFLENWTVIFLSLYFDANTIESLIQRRKEELMTLSSLTESLLKSRAEARNIPINQLTVKDLYSVECQIPGRIFESLHFDESHQLRFWRSFVPTGYTLPDIEKSKLNSSPEAIRFQREKLSKSVKRSLLSRRYQKKSYFRSGISPKLFTISEVVKKSYAVGLKLKDVESLEYTVRVSVDYSRLVHFKNCDSLFQIFLEKVAETPISKHPLFIKEIRDEIIENTDQLTSLISLM